MRAKFVLTEAATGLWRNVTMTIAMILTTAISLFLLGLGGIGVQVVNEAKDLLFFKIEVTIFLKEGIQAAQRDGIESKLKNDALVQTYEFETKEEAYTRFQELFKDTPDLVENVKPEALPESFRVKLKDPKQAAQLTKKYSGDDGVDRVQDQKAVLGGIFSIADGVKTFAFIIASFQGLAAVLLIGNTIQVAAYSRRREVSIMKLVGASNWYVRLPFILEAAVAGLIGAIIGGLGLVLVKWAAVDRLLDPLFQTGLFPRPSWMLFFVTWQILALISVAIAGITGWITLRFYVKV